MASIIRRRNRDGSASYDVTVRIVGFPTACQSFSTKLEAERWAARIESTARGPKLTFVRQMTLAQLIDDGMPHLVNPVAAAFAYWRDQLGTRRLHDVTPQMIAIHRDLLLDAATCGFKHKRLKQRSPATVRNYLLQLSRLFTWAIREARVCDTNPVDAVTKPPASRWRIRFLTDDERTRLLARARGRMPSICICSSCWR